MNIEPLDRCASSVGRCCTDIDNDCSKGLALWSRRTFANQAGVPIIAGGPHPTSYYDNIKEETDATIDHFLFGEVEGDLWRLLNRFLRAVVRKRFYRETRKPDITKTPPPRYDLIDINALWGRWPLQFFAWMSFQLRIFAILRSCFGRVPRDEKQWADARRVLKCSIKLGWDGGDVLLLTITLSVNKRDAMRFASGCQAVARRTPNSRSHSIPKRAWNLVEIPENAWCHEWCRVLTWCFLGIESPQRWSTPEYLQRTEYQQRGGSG